MPRLPEEVVRKSISRPVIIYIMNLKRGRAPVLWLVCSLLGEHGKEASSLSGDK